jgi:hypothetical protein
MVVANGSYMMLTKFHSNGWLGVEGLHLVDCQELIEVDWQFAVKLKEVDFPLTSIVWWRDLLRRSEIEEI